MKYYNIILILVLFLILSPVTSLSQQRFPEDTGVQWIGDWPLAGAPEEVFLNNGRLLSSTISGAVEWDFENQDGLIPINSFPTRGVMHMGAYTSTSYTYPEYIFPTLDIVHNVFQLIDDNASISLTMDRIGSSTIYNPEYNEFIVLSRYGEHNFMQFDISDPLDPELLVILEDSADRFAFYNDTLLVCGSNDTDRIFIYSRDENNIWQHINSIDHDDPTTFFLHADTLLAISWEFMDIPYDNLSNDIYFQRYLITDLTSPVELEPDTLFDFVSPDDGMRISNARFSEIDDNHLIIATEEGYLSVVENHFSDEPIVIDTLIFDYFGYHEFDDLRINRGNFYFRESNRRLARIDNEIFIPTGRGISTVNISDLENVFIDSSRCTESGGEILSANNNNNYLVTKKEIYYQRDLYRKIDVYCWEESNWNEHYHEVIPVDSNLNPEPLIINERYLLILNKTSESHNSLVIRDMVETGLSDTMVFSGSDSIYLDSVFNDNNGEYYAFINHAYGAGGVRKLHKLNLEIPQFIEICSFSISSTYKASNGFLYIMNNETISSYALSDTMNLENPISTIEADGRILTVNDNYLWIDSSNLLITLVSIADPANLEIENIFTGPVCKKARSSIGETAFFMSLYNDTTYYDMIYDITYPENPQEVAILGKSTQKPLHSFSLGDTLWVLDSFTLTGYKMDYEVGVEESSTENLPSEYVLHPCCPNPFNPSTTIALEIPEIADLKLIVYNTLGQQVTLLVDRKLLAGKHKFTWNGKNASGQDVASGIYFVQMQSPSSTLSQKMVLLR